MAGEIKLPVIGSIKKSWAYAGGAAVVVIVGIAWIRHRNSGGAAASAPDVPADLTGEDTSSSASDLDPDTGFIAGSPQDQEALAELDDSGGGDFAGGFDGGGFDDLLPSAGTTSTANTGPGTFTNNAEWIAWCEQNVVGYGPEQIQSALSAAEAHVKVTEKQLTIFRACLAVGGQPPEPIPTPQVRATGTGGHSGKVKVPKVTGISYAEAALVLGANGLKPHRAEPDVGTVTSQHPDAGTEVDHGSTVTLSGGKKKGK